MFDVDSRPYQLIHQWIKEGVKHDANPLAHKPTKLEVLPKEIDLDLPGMDGIATLQQIRELYPRLPVIMFSAVTERGASDTLEALHYGASDYVTKPVDIDDLLARFRTWWT